MGGRPATEVGGKPGMEVGGRLAVEVGGMPGLYPEVGGRYVGGKCGNRGGAMSFGEEAEGGF